MATRTAKEYLESLSADELCYLGVEYGVINIEEVQQRLLDEYGDMIEQEIEEQEDE
jgi:hypothetical protein